MASNQYRLLGQRRFWPLFGAQTLGAFNDNFFKNALIVLVTYRLAAEVGANQPILVTLGGMIFIIPFLVFSALGGQLADRFERSRVLKLVKVAEIPIMVFAAVAFAMGNVTLLLSVLFLMGVQSALFSPVRYAIMPDHLKRSELIGGNALMEGGVFIALLLGTIFGTLLIRQDHGIAIVSTIVITAAIIGTLVSLAIPRSSVPSSAEPINLNLASEIIHILRYAAGYRAAFVALLGVAWFYFLGATFLVQLPNYTAGVLNANEQVLALFLTLFSVGIALGSILCNRLLNGEISARLAPVVLVLISIFMVDLVIATGAATVTLGEPIGLAAWFGPVAHWRILVDLLAVAVLGGIFVVPLYAIVQSTVPVEHRARTLAGSNILNAAAGIISSVLAVALIQLGLDIHEIFFVVALANLVVAGGTIMAFREHFVRGVLKGAFKILFRAEVRGLEHYRSVDGPAVIIANHVSYLDGLLLAGFLPGWPVYAVHTEIAEKPWIKPWLRLVKTMNLDPANPYATRRFIRLVQGGEQAVIFPEGRITETGTLMKMYDGAGLIADRTGVPMIPIRIDGPEFTPLSRLTGGRTTLRLFRKITITIDPPEYLQLPEGLRGKARRRLAAERLYERMTRQMFTSRDTDKTLPQAIVDARRHYGGKAVVLDDVERKILTFDKLGLGAIVLGRKLAAMSSKGEQVGVLLPNVSGTPVVILGLQLFGRVPALLNFSAGAANLVSACNTAQIKTVFTARAFVERGNLHRIIEAISEVSKVVYLEDIRASISPLDKVRGLLSLPRLGAIARKESGQPDDAAVVLFTSGSEGRPKGVVLSHRNIIANCHQTAARVDFNRKDVVFTALPLFHAFGLTGGLFLPLLHGVRVYLYPSPLHYRLVPEMVYHRNATVLFGTDTFLRGYARMAHPYDFRSLRLVVAGAEKVREETRQMWIERYGLRILEGYGATETGPILSLNSPLRNRAGTVGHLLPGMDYRIEPVPGIETGGRLQVRGANVMKGYLRPTNPGVLEPPDDGWYDTGDIVTLDEDGFLVIIGRAKRFAKVAGEMISLPMVEDLVSAVYSEGVHAVIALPDGRKGERLVVVTTNPEVDRKALAEGARARGLPELAIPRSISVVKEIPVLGTGKTDYVTLIEQATADLEDGAAVATG